MPNMWNTSLFKTNAKANFSLSYWPFVAVSVLLILLNSEFFTVQLQTYMGDISWLAPYLPYVTDNAVFPWDEWTYRVIYRFQLPWFLLIAIQLLVTNPYEVGACRFFLDNNGSQRAPFSVTIEAGFLRNFGNIVLTQFLRNLFIFLWSLLFVIPGIIAAYRYSFAFYNLYEDPGIGVMEALDMSKRQTLGYKAQLFALDLSYIGWCLLATLPSLLLIFQINRDLTMLVLYGIPTPEAYFGLPIFALNAISGFWQLLVALFYFPNCVCVRLSYFDVAKRTSGVGKDAAPAQNNPWSGWNAPDGLN